MTTKVMALRREDVCSICATSLGAGTKAQWDKTAKSVTCLECVEAARRRPDHSMSTPPAAPEGAPLDIGTPGASARKEFERRRARREQKVEAKWGTGRMGRFAKAVSDDPQSTKAWAQGAGGEERVAEILTHALADQAILLHDRKVPRHNGNIDHIVIAPSGVWIVDAKRYTGKVEKRDIGGWFRTDLRLYVGDRDRTKLATGMQWQREAVRLELGDRNIPVRCALSFVGTEWPIFFAKPFRLEDVWISWPARLAELILTSASVIAPERLEPIARGLAGKLPAN
jgi:hypothetical protein